MMKLKTNFSGIKKSNLVYIMEKKSDIKKLDFLSLDCNIINKIQDFIWKEQHQKFSFFLWSSQFESVFVFIYSKKSKQDINYFLWGEFSGLPNHLTLLSNHAQNINILLNNCLLGRYKFQKYKSDKKEDTLYFILDKEEKKQAQNRLSTIENILLARDLGFTPSNDLFPEAFAKIIKKTPFKKTKVKIFDFKKIQKLWLGLLQNVWKGSSHKPYMVVMERIINKKYPTIWIVWKWITFDTWWIQVKPWDHMYEMKWDMCGAANTYALMKELDDKKLKVNIVACLVLAENHISWESYKPSDIVTSYSWKTVDIIHTDAEWRLVLADGISYISKNYHLDKVISIATLTWACMVALWFRYAWIMGNDESFIQSLLHYSNNNIEKYNRLPFDDYFIEKTKSEVADLENLNRWVYAWSTMWWAFLANFLLHDEKYTHIDIAWTALNSFEPYAYVNKWMTGFWVDSLSSIIQDF